jgi:site-specific recombinase XerC
MRIVASNLGHADLSTTMHYTNRDAQVLILAWEEASPGSVANEIAVE